MNWTKYFALIILIFVSWFRGMVVKACFQINTETIGLDLSQLLFSNRDGLLVVDDFLSEAEVGSKQSWIF